MADLPPYPGAPRWVRVSGIVIGVVVLLVTIAVFLGMGGSHGPGNHGPTGVAAGHGGGGLLLFVGVLLLAAVVGPNWGWLVDRDYVRQRRSLTAERWSLRWLAARVATIMTPRLRKLVLVVHVTSSVGSLGAVAVFLALAAVGLASQDARLVRATYIANELIAWYIILPFILTALLIGIVQSLSTPWGLFRHYWVLAKLVLATITVSVLIPQLDGISQVAGVAADTNLSAADLLGLRRSMRFHAAGGLSVLLLLVVLSIYKPRGMTRYGWRKQHEPPGAPHRALDVRNGKVPTGSDANQC